MMKYKVIFSSKAEKQLLKFDQYTQRRIYKWIKENLEDCENPRMYGKALVNDELGQWRYRVGDYRILAKIDDSAITILVMRIAHRREVYRVCEEENMYGRKEG